MIYRTYGSTGVKVSAIGFGGMRFKDQNDVDGCAGLVKAAYDKGITYFDTAIGYGKSEELFGEAFKEMKKTRAAKPFYVSTKTMAADAKGVRSEVETSLKRMGLDHIDFYHVWCVMSMEAWNERKTKGAVKEFEKLKAEGLVKHICVSTHMSGDDVGAMLADYPFDGVLLGYSVMNFAYREAGLDAAAKLKRGVVVMNPLGGGIIPQHPERFSFVRTRDNETVVQGALRFLLSDPRITVALVGFSDKQHLDEALGATDGFSPLPKQKIDHIRASLKQAYNELCTGCGYCDECPQKVPIPRMMDAYNHYLLSNKPRDMIDRLAWHWWTKPGDPVFDACVECGKCEKLCTQKLPITKRLKEIAAEAKKAEQERK